MNFCFSIDCIGILKLRNSDVEAMVSTTRSRKKSQRARMVFRVCVPRADGSSFTLQTMSDTIQCCEFLKTAFICETKSLVIGNYTFSRK